MTCFDACHGSADVIDIYTNFESRLEVMTLGLIKRLVLRLPREQFRRLLRVIRHDNREQPMHDTHSAGGRATPGSINIGKIVSNINENSSCRLTLNVTDDASFIKKRN
jgi:hypothetical protein